MGFFIGVLSIFITICSFVIIVFTALRNKRWVVAVRLRELTNEGKDNQDSEPLELPFYERIIIPLFSSFGDLLARLTPARVIKSLDERLWAAGYMNKNRVAQFFTVQSIWLISLPLIAAALTYLLKIPVGRAWFLVIVAIGFSLLYPTIRIYNKKLKRAEGIKKQLPNAIDLLVVSVEAGLGFDMAIEKVIEKMSGPLSDEFNYTLNEIRMGKPRPTALREMVQRIKIEELDIFIGSIIQAEQLGVSIGNVLRIQSDSMRTRRRQAIEEKAMKAPVKMLFPLVFFILPALFVIILGPALLHLMRILTQVR
jgi:tight adherence protein C